jgi:hypothetical protein
MTKFHPIFKALLVCSFALAFVSIAQAQASRTWVSGSGDDADPCSRTAPCKSFSGAHSKTPVNGEINCIDAGPYGPLIITKSITIDCHEVFAGALHSGQNGVSINFDSFSGTDTRKSVRLRNINYQGANTGTRGIRITGGFGSAGSTVHVQDCLIDGNFGSPGRGIEDNRSGGGSLLVTNTTIRNLSGTGISHAPNSGSTRVDISIDNVRIFNCLFGVAVSSGGRMSITNSVIAGCTNAGLYAEGPQAASELHADNVVINHNGIGIQQIAAGTIRIGNSDITNNTTNGTSGTVSSYGNNRVAGNAGVTTLTPVGADSHDKGQQ